MADFPSVGDENTWAPKLQAYIDEAAGSSSVAIDPADYGAAADGTTDDSAALNSAITVAAVSGGLGIVKLARGRTYAVSAASIALASSVWLDGNAATLKWTGTGNNPLLLSGVSNVIVSDLTVDCGTTPPGQAVYGTGSDHVELHRVKVTSTAFTGAGIRLSGFTNSTIDDCDVSGTAMAFNIIGASQFCTIRNSRATNTLAGFQLGISGTSGVSDVDLIGCTASAFPSGQTLSYPIRAVGTTSVHLTRVRFLNCTAIGPNVDFSHGGTADQINAVWTDDIKVIGCTSRYGGDMGMSFSNCTDLVLTGNTSKLNDTGGIVVSAGCVNATVTGNLAKNNGQNHEGTVATQGRFGIGTGGGSNVNIAGNTIVDDQTTHTQNYGVRLQGGGDNIKIGPNVYKGNAVADFYTDATPTNVTNSDAGAAGADVFGKRVAYASTTASATAATTGSGWQAFTGGTAAPSITLPNDGGVYRLDLHGTGAVVTVSGILSIALSGDGGSTWIKQAAHNHNNANVSQDRVHLAAGNVVGTGQTITVWGQGPASNTATLTATNSSPLELWATRVA